MQVNCIACIVAKGTKLDSMICCNKLIIKFKCCSHILVHFVLDSSHLDSILSGKVYSKNANIFANWQKLAKSFYRVNKETIWPYFKPELQSRETVPLRQLLQLNMRLTAPDGFPLVMLDL